MLITAEQAPSIVADPDVTRCDLPVQGMTCASCVLRVERALKATPGVQEAHVNLVTRRASVVFDRAATGPEALARAIEAVGYEVPRAAAVTAQRPGRRAEAQAQAEVDEQRALRRDFVVAAALGGPLLIVAMSHGAIPGLDGSFGRWLQFGLATPVVFGPGRRFLRLAWAALRHRAADMNTLVSLGVLAAWSYSTVALVAPGLFPHAEHGLRPHLYFEAAAAI
ncbi:MAG: cation-translocating P-type ATPase, partial [Myxococcales bacterium]|nr:cation-translocating P-type ATPase [Myxococcales bacterium]